jgi:hypothetical protein
MPAVRQEAIKLAETFSENEDGLNNASWAVVRKPDASAADYELALRRAEAACRLKPNGMNLNTLGVAQYRAGGYREALKTLQSEPLKPKAPQHGHPADLAFIAMAQHRLGHKDQAQATMVRMRAAMQEAQWRVNGDAQNFLREAEELLRTKPVNGNK